MKSAFGDRDTLGKMIFDTHEKHIKSDKIEVGDMGREMGKSYMKAILDCMEKHSGAIDKFYIRVYVDKSKMYLERAMNLNVCAFPDIPPMEPDSDVWFVDFRKQKLECLWTLPEKKDFKYYLENQNKYHPDLIKNIKIYCKGMKIKI